MTAFDDSAEYYEALANSAQRLQREGPFLLERLGRAPGRRVVDIACGTAPHAQFFAEQGAQVTALDFSELMIAYARRHRPHENIRYRTGDMRRIEGGPWDFALCLGNSLSVLSTDEDLRETFDAVHRVLAPGGLFIVQIINYAAAANQSPRHRVERRALETSELVAVKNLVPHGEHTLLTLNFFAIHEGQTRTVSEAMLLKNWGEQDQSDAAGRAGFRILEVLGGFDARPYDPASSTDLILTCAK